MRNKISLLNKALIVTFGVMSFFSSFHSNASEIARQVYFRAYKCEENGKWGFIDTTGKRSYSIYIR